MSHSAAFNVMGEGTCVQHPESMKQNTCCCWLRTNFYKFLPAVLFHVPLRNPFQGFQISALLLLTNEGSPTILMIMVDHEFIQRFETI